MKELVTAARNVVNTDEIMAWLNALSERYSTLTLWIGGPVRKWVNKNAPTVPFQATDTKGLPDWLKKAMDSGAAAETVVLDDALEGRIVPVLDYMTELVTIKPDTNVAAIGFDVAEKRSIEWHERMAKTAEKLNPIPEDGAEIYKDYGNGWTWRKLVGKECLINEGEAMGHCVGRFGYYERILRDKVDIFSLRDPNNAPHVTIEAEMASKSIFQIKGRANEDVVAKYLPMVEDFLDMHEWDRIVFDGAASLAKNVTEKQLLKREPIIEAEGVKIVRVPSWSTARAQYKVFLNGNASGEFMVDTKNRTIDSLSVMLYGTVPHVLATLIARESWLVSDSAQLPFLFADLPQGVWTELPSTVFKWAIQSAFFAEARVDWVYLQKDSFSTGLAAGYASDIKTTFIHQSVNASKAMPLALELPLEQQHVIRKLWGSDKGSVLIDVQDRVRKLQAGQKVKIDSDDETLLNSLLTALKQPDVATIKAAYLKMKSKDEVLDSHMKYLNLPVSGRAINGIAAVLMCSLPIKNLAPFQRYVFHKPNLLTCWVEVLTKPDHILAGLKQYGLDEDAIASIVTLLRNEFLRLVPTDIDALDLDGGPAAKVKQVMRWAAGHRIDQARSKKLWGNV